MAATTVVPVGDAPAERHLLTAEEFFQLPSTEGKQELVRGEVVTMVPPGGEHADVQGELLHHLRQHGKRSGAGRALGEAGFRLFGDQDTVRAPDVAFVLSGRLPGGKVPRTFIDGAPDIAVEIVSPNDTAAEIEEKVGEYLEAGAQRVWVLYPSTGSVVVHRPDRTSVTLRGEDVLTGEDVLPGFEVRVNELFEG